MHEFMHACAGFDAAVADFERWVCLLLLDGMQRAGLFRTLTEAHTLDSLRGRVASDYARFIAEALAILKQHGVKLVYPPLLSPASCMHVTHVSACLHLHSRLALLQTY